MTIKSILLTTLVVTSLKGTSQILNDVWNATKDAAKDAATEAVKTNTTASAAVDLIKGVAGGTNAATPSLTNDEVIKGLKEALSVGTTNSSGNASKVDGYLKNAKLFIPWPAEAKDMKDKLIKMGMQKKVTEFETSLNRAAEEAAKKSAPVFMDAITGMSISDGFAILKGSDSAATHYLREKTFAPLKAQFMPVVKEAIAKAKVASLWTPLATTYNKLPGVKKQNPDLNDYICTKAVNGLMTLILDEEAKIRKDPLARVSDILKKVFGSVFK
jgi:Protein of unknown function (DUF4197)